MENNISIMQDITDSNQIFMSILGNVIEKYRKLHNKSIYSISAEVSMSKSTWREAEKGACNDIKLTTLWKIAEGLEMRPSDLLKEIENQLGEDFSFIENEK